MSASSLAAARKKLNESTVNAAPASSWLPERRTLLSCVLLIFVALASYSRITHNEFLNYDDDRYITDNPHVKAGLTWATVKWAFTTYDEANWAPLSWLSHALDCEIFGLNPAGHHLVNVSLHALSAVLLFLLLKGMTGFPWRSLFIAALFALHPINVESVAWAAERKNVLSMMFFLLSLHAYVWYTRKPAVGRYALVFLMFALGLLSKSQVITLPFLLLLLDYWPLGRMGDEGLLTGIAVEQGDLYRPDKSKTLSAFGSWTARRNGNPKLWNLWLVVEKLPLLALSLASALITSEAEKAGGAVKSFARYSLSLRLETAAISYVSYLYKAFWPMKLVALYPHPTRLYPAWHVISAIAILSMVSTLVFIARERRYLAVGWLWFLGSMVPMIGLVQVGPQAMADRFAYLPFIGVFVMFTWLAVEATRAVKVSNRALASAAAGYVLVLGALTYKQVGYWHDVASFWQRTVALTENNYVAENNLGIVLFQQNKPDEAAAHFRSALAINSGNVFANLNLAAYEDSRGNVAVAMERYESIAHATNDVDIRAAAYTSLGFDCRALGLRAKAKEYFETAVNLAPHRARAIVGLGLVAQENGDWEQAIQQYSQAVAVHPTDVGYFLLAKALEHVGRLDESRAASARIVNPADAQAVAETFLSGK